jgi:hypothetical protein
LIWDFVEDEAFQDLAEDIKEENRVITCGTVFSLAEFMNGHNFC